MNITYTHLQHGEYSQRTMGPNSGVRIQTDCIRMEPLLLERDAPLLWAIYKDHPDLFKYMPHGNYDNYNDFYALQTRFCTAPDHFNWVVYVKATKDDPLEDDWVLCGSICLLDIVLPFRRFEVGAIWFMPEVHGTFVMVETTYALLRFSFEQCLAGRVQWKTHHGNIPSQKAALRLGFDFDGIHRKHMIHHDGTWRHTYYYSMTDDDWFGREETTDARQGIEQQQQQPGSEPRGRQLQLEQVIGGRKQTGKPMPLGLCTRG